ncbi:MAG: tetratricopeptide repeat protein [Candidatus Omnitrophota bacterium]
MSTRSANAENPLLDKLQDALNSMFIRGRVNRFEPSIVTQVETFLRPKVGETAKDVANILSNTEWYIASRPDQIDCNFALALEYQEGVFFGTKGEVWFPLHVAANEQRHLFALLIAACDKKQIPREITAALIIHACDEFALPGEKEGWKCYYTGWALERFAQYDKAAEFYERALCMNPRNTDAFIYKACCLGFICRHAEAVKICEKVLNSGGKSLRAYFYKGFSLSRLGVHAEAVTCFDRILQADKSDKDVWYNRGVSLGGMGRHEAAAQSYSEALKLNGNDKSAWYNKGLELQSLGRHPEALVCFQKAASLGHEKAGMRLL